MARTDTHRPSVFDPAEYEYVGVMYHGRIFGGISDSMHTAIEALNHQSFDGNYKKKGTCDHCGAWFEYGVVHRHNPTGDAICVGHICTENAFGHDTRVDYDMMRLRNAIKARRATEKLAKLKAAFNEEHGSDLEKLFKVDHHITRDIERYFDKKGTLSPAQLNLLEKIADQAKAREARQEKRAAHDALSEHVGEIGKRQEFTAMIEKLIWVDNQYGGTSIHLMRTPEGAKLVWFCSGSDLGKEKEIVIFKATVKDHGERDGAKQTVVNRCKAVTN